MLNRRNLAAIFANIGLTLEFAKVAFSSNADVFGLDIRRKNPAKPATEFFLMWPGHQDNTVVVRNTHDGHRQLVLTVTEAEREFEEIVPRASVLSYLKNHGEHETMSRFTGMVRAGFPKVKVWKPKKGELVVIHKTPRGSRNFLMGMDERQLFMTQVGSRVTTVEQAHASLKAPAVTFFEGRASGKTIRQGEWFFINLPELEMTALQLALKKNKVSVLRKAAIGAYAGRSGGKPHLADELVCCEPLELEAPTHEEFTVPTGIVNVHIHTFRRGNAELGLQDMLRANKLRMADVVKWDPERLLLIVRRPVRSSQQMVVSPSIVGRKQVYIRGAVRHPDHETVKFSSWRKVIANTENGVAQAGARATGGTWID